MDYIKEIFAWWEKHIFIGSVIFALICALIIYIFMGASSFSHGSGSTLKCNTCGHTYEAGDSGGNYTSIAKTGMCKSCYRDFMALQQAVGD